jgi:hypothetical protein
MCPMTTAAEFEAICAGFCEIAGVAAPVLQAEADGVVAFNVRWRGVTVDVIYSAFTGGAHAFVLFDLGSIDRSGPDATRILDALLAANFFAMQANPPTFSCHPDTGDAVLRCVFPLADAHPAALHEIVNEGVALALEWRETFFLAPATEQEDIPVKGFA